MRWIAWAACFCVTACLPACGDASPPVHSPAPAPVVLSSVLDTTLDVKVDNANTGYQIHNQDNIVWTDCTFTINANKGKGGYSVKIESVKPEKSIHLAPGQFSNDEGERFNIFTHKPSSMDIVCDVPSGGQGSAHLHSVEDDQDGK